MMDDDHHKDSHAQDDAHWREKLTDEQYDVLRRKGTEAPFSGAYWDNHERGRYRCAGCGTELFSSDAKFDSGTGWPSFSDVIGREKVALREDASHGMRRTEVVCKTCGGHLGHIFDDGPRESKDAVPPTGKRYCINSCALAFDAHERENREDINA